MRRINASMVNEYIYLPLLPMYAIELNPSQRKQLKKTEITVLSNSIDAVIFLAKFLTGTTRKITKIEIMENKCREIAMSYGILYMAINFSSVFSLESTARFFDSEPMINFPANRILFCK
jgi:hypothetical protein